MKKVLFILSVLLLSTQWLDAQEAMNLYYENGQLKLTIKHNSKGKPTGEATSYYENGQLMEIGVFENGKQVGEWRSYYENGQLKSIGEYSKEKKTYDYENEQLTRMEQLEGGKEKGEWKYYYENGQLKSIGEYSKGKKIYYYENGQLIRIEQLEGGNGKGEWKHYYENGQLKEIGSYNQEGHKEGEWKYYYENGQLNRIGSHHKTCPIGEWKYYYKGGQLKIVGNFLGSGNTKIGEWKFYHENGKIKREENYKQGKIDGLVMSFHENGEKFSEVSYVDGKLFGQGIYWNNEGKLTQKINFINDNTADRKYYYPNGNIKIYGIDKYSNEEKKWLRNGSWTFNYKNGQKHKVEIYENGKHKGYWEQYLPDGTQILKDGNGEYRVYENGVMTFKSEHRNGSRDGVSTWYYENGQEAQSALYKYDEASKPFGLRWQILSSFHKDGTPRKKGTLKNGNGTWIDYDKDGSEIGKKKYKNGIEIE